MRKLILVLLFALALPMSSFSQWGGARSKLIDSTEFGRIFAVWTIPGLGVRGIESIRTNQIDSNLNYVDVDPAVCSISISSMANYTIADTVYISVMQLDSAATVIAVNIIDSSTADYQFPIWFPSHPHSTFPHSAVSQTADGQHGTFYPNPVASTLHIMPDGLNHHYAIYSLLGQRLIESQERDIDVRALRNGHYFFAKDNRMEPFVVAR